MASSRLRPPIQVLPLPYLMLIPVLLAIATLITLFARSDVNVALLWSQCHARERLPALSWFPGLGTPMCALVAFFQEALDSLRTRAEFVVILGFVGGLMTVSLVESARAGNAENVLIAYPTGSWLAFNLVGGAVVWELIIIPAFLHRAKTLVSSKKVARVEDLGEEEASSGGAERVDEDERHLSSTEVVAIPIAVALGFYLPSVFMIVCGSVAAICVWLFFPLYVSIVRQLARRAVKFLFRAQSVKVYLESQWHSLLCVYALPVIWSVSGHIFFVFNMAAMKDDRKEMTRSTIPIVEIDFAYIGLTVLYWIFVEVGWRVPLVMIISTVIVGPGAGMCLGWIYREMEIRHWFVRQAELDRDDEEAPPDERTRLLDN